MILKALYDYYERCGDLPVEGLEKKKLHFLLVLSPDGKFLRFEDCRSDDLKHGRPYWVRRDVGRASDITPNWLYDTSSYVLGISNPPNGKDIKRQNAFIKKAKELLSLHPDSPDLRAIAAFYDQSPQEILDTLSKDPLWDEVKNNLKSTLLFSFRLNGDVQIVAEKQELILSERGTKGIGKSEYGNRLFPCLVTGKLCHPVVTAASTPITWGKSGAKLVAIQKDSGYDSYGKQQGFNAPTSPEAEFKYSTALQRLLERDSRNKFTIGSRTFVFWATPSEAAREAEQSFYDFFGFSDAPKGDNPNTRIEQVRSVFKSISSGKHPSSSNDRFYILGLAPNSGRIAVVYWSETPLKEFAATISRHFDDMEMNDSRPAKKRYPYMGVRDMLAAVTLGGKVSDASPNLPEAIMRSIFTGTPYPMTLLAACVRRLRAECKTDSTIGRAAILKACINRQHFRTSSSNQQNPIPLKPMLDKENTNLGYLSGRLFAVLDKVQEQANNITSLRERYLNAASSTPAAVFATILNLSAHHSEKLNPPTQIYYEKLKQEILDKFPADGFPSHLSLQDQGRFFVGYYHQRQDLFTAKPSKDQVETAADTEATDDDQQPSQPQPSLFDK